MTEYIEREEALKILENMRLDYENNDCPVHALCEDYMDALETAEDKLNTLIAANVRPERHGEWILDDSDEYANHFHCSRCGFEKDTCNEIYVEPPPPYCEHCGAKMSWEEDTI